MNKEDFEWELRYYAPYGLHNPEGRIFWKSTFPYETIEIRDYMNCGNESPEFNYEIHFHEDDKSFYTGSWEEVVFVLKLD